MKCSYCDKEDAVMCVCGHFTCEEHTHFIREENLLKPVCIHCYEEALTDQQSKL